MQEPQEQIHEDNTRVQLDRDVLSAMLKAWLIPRTTGNLDQTDSDIGKKKGCIENSEEHNQ